MLKCLEIQNVALIDKSSIEFLPNLNVLSGETGAGKSIIIDALNFVIGGKVIKSLIKQGQDFMKVNAMFLPPFSPSVCELLQGYDIDFEDELLITRKATIDGKNDIKVNGTTITVSMLKNLTSLLIDIHGQHEHQHLLKDKYHLEIIDSFIINKAIFEEYKEKIDILKSLQSQIKKLNGSTQNQERVLDLLSYQIKEIEDAKLIEGEDDDLQQRKISMMNFEKINDSLNGAIEELDGSASIINGLKKSFNYLNNISKFDSELLGLCDRLQSSKFEILDILETLKQKQGETNFNQNEFDLIDERLDKIKLLKKKYGSTISEILEFLEKSKKEYDTIVNSKDILIKTLQEKEVVLKEIFEITKKIRKEREFVAANFEKQVLKELSDLGMKNSKFTVLFNDFVSIENIEENLNSSGCDVIKFMFSANAGQSLKPLSEIISGGEASRFMLGLKNILAENDNISSMVFDEIDTGISGDMGYKVACKLANIAKNHQVMSVSHLPQICAMADNNLKIIKQVVDNNTIVKANILNFEDCLNEIARLSGGVENNEASISHARELKKRCNQYKEGL